MPRKAPTQALGAYAAPAVVRGGACRTALPRHARRARAGMCRGKGSRTLRPHRRRPTGVCSVDASFTALLKSWRGWLLDRRARIAVGGLDRDSRATRGRRPRGNRAALSRQRETSSRPRARFRRNAGLRFSSDPAANGRRKRCARTAPLPRSRSLLRRYWSSSEAGVWNAWPRRLFARASRHDR